MSTYTIQGGDTLYSIASKLNTTVAILEEANQGIDPSKLQVGQVIQLTVNHGTSYTIKAGDTLYSIAQSQNSTVEAIEKANPGLVPTDLKIGAQITISSTGSAPPAPSPTPPPSQNSTPQPASSSLYTIQEGDTFEIIGAKFGVSDRAIEAANPGAVRTNLQIGAQLVIPGNSAPPQPAPTPTPAPTPSPPMANAYTIQGGDTYEIIAAKFGTTAAAIAAANPTLVPTNLQIGAQISIPGQNEQTPAPAPAPAPVPQPTPLEATNTYTIQSGDTFSNIATKLNTTADAIQAANPSVNPTTLQVGQIINVPQGGSGPVQPQPTTGIPGGTEIGGGYVNYSGPASNFPDPSRWAPYSVLWEQNKTLLSYNDSPHQIDLIASSIQTVSASSGIDPRAILCTIMQESGGNVHVGNTFNGIVNTGIMQAFNGVNFDPNNEEGSILQMIRDGSEGSSNGPGLKQAMAQYGNYYVAFRTYNSGSPNLVDLNDARGATGDYVQKMANRLMGHVWNGM